MGQLRNGGGFLFEGDSAISPEKRQAVCALIKDKMLQSVVEAAATLKLAPEPIDPDSSKQAWVLGEAFVSIMASRVEDVRWFKELAEAVVACKPSAGKFELRKKITAITDAPDIVQRVAALEHLRGSLGHMCAELHQDGEYFYPAIPVVGEESLVMSVLQSHWQKVTAANEAMREISAPEFAAVLDRIVTTRGRPSPQGGLSQGA